MTRNLSGTLQSVKNTKVPLRVPTGFGTPDKTSIGSIFVCIPAILAAASKPFKAATGLLRMLPGIDTGQLFVTLLLLMSLDQRIPDFLHRTSIKQPAASGSYSYQIKRTMEFNMVEQITTKLEESGI